MDTLLLGITVVSLILALVTSVTAWRLMRDEKQRSAARIAALSAAAQEDVAFAEVPVAAPVVNKPIERVARTPWKPAPFDSSSSRPPADDLSFRSDRPIAMPSTGFLGSTDVDRSSANHQRGLAVATVAFFIVVTGGFLWLMSGPDSAPPAAAATSKDAALELVSLSHARPNSSSTGLRAGKLEVSGLVRNPVSGQPIEKLSAVVFLFDRAGTFVTSSKAQVDFLKLGAGDESPFVVSIDAPESVARYRVSFRTDDGVVPHIDRRGQSPSPSAGEQPVNVTLK